MKTLRVQSDVIKEEFKVLIFILSVLAISGCGMTCKEKIIRQIKSPNGRYVAVIFERDCGATDSLQYHVNLRRTWGWFWSEPEGNTRDGQVFLTESGEIKVEWKDNHNMYIECSECKDADHSKICTSSWKDVSIVCKVGT